MTTLAAHPPHCHACGYDTTSIAPNATRCPECGVALSAWRSRWHTRLTLHGLTLLVFGAAACACIWMLNHAVRSWLTAGGAQITDNLSTVRPTEALIFIPAIFTLTGLALLALTSTESPMRRGFSFMIIFPTAAALCIMLAQRTLAGAGSYDGPVWMRLVTVRDAGWWACAALVPLCAGAALSLLSGVARSAGLPALSWWCARAALWLPLAALLAIGSCELYEYIARSVINVPQTQAFPGAPVLNPGQSVRIALPTIVPPPWYWTTGVQFARLLLYTFLIASSTAIWLAAYFTRLRLRDALDPNH